MSDKEAKSTAGLGCMILFLTPFLLGGAFALGKGISDLSKGEGFTEPVIAALGVGSMFLLVSSCFLALLLHGHRRTKEANRREAEFPGEPWLWREDWASGHIASNSPAAVLVLWFFGLVFGGFGSFVLFKAQEILEEGTMAFAAALLFPGVGLLMIVGAVYKTVAYRKFGRAHCELVTNPGVVGGWFKAAVRAKVPISPGDTAIARLNCIHKYTTGSGKNSSTHRDSLWQKEKTIDHAGIGVDREGLSTFPVIFYIPRDCRQTDDRGEDEILWELGLTCSVPGIDFQQSWEVPVFVTAESVDKPPAEIQEDLAELFEEKDYARTSAIRVTPTAGGLEIYAPPARAKGPAVFTTVFTVIWTAAIVFMIQKGAPILFPIAFGLFDIIMVWITLSLWFGSVRTSIRNDAISFRHSILGVGSAKNFTSADVENVQVAMGMQAGETSYYRVNLHTTENRDRTVAAFIRDKNEARWLQQLIAEQLNVPAKDAPLKKKHRK